MKQGYRNVYLIYNLIALSVNRAGFWSAMASNLTNQSRNVLSKKVMVKNEVIYVFHIHVINNYKFLIGKKLGRIVIRSRFLILLSFLVYLRVFCFLFFLFLIFYLSRNWHNQKFVLCRNLWITLHSSR